MNALRETLCHLRVTFKLQRLRQQAHGPHRRLQLMRHVGDEVTANVLEATALRDVLNHRQHAEGTNGVVNHDGTYGQGATRWSVQVDGSLRGAELPPFGQQLRHRLRGDGVAVATGHENVRLGVSVDHVARLIAEDESDRESVERAAQSDDVGGGFVDLGRGFAGHGFEIGQHVFDLAGVTLRTVTESMPERFEALRHRSHAATAPQGDAQQEAHDNDTGGRAVHLDRCPLSERVGEGEKTHVDILPPRDR